MKKLIAKIKNFKKKKQVKEGEIHEEWLGAEARVIFSKEDEKSLKQKRRKR